jgi:hypothetical protein
MRNPSPFDALSRGQFAALGLGCMGIAFAMPSLSYPFGPDQGLYAYVGREWLAGFLPYQSTFDVKTPGIYLIHLFAFWLGGARTWPVRVLELGCVLLLAWTVPTIARFGRRPPASAVGLSILATSILYYGYFNYWDTGQCEIWCAASTFLALFHAVKVRFRARPSQTDALRILGAGASAGCALLFKPPVVPLLAVVGVVLLVQAAKGSRGSRSTRIAYAAFLFALGVFAPVVLVVAYFTAHGAHHAMYDVLIVNNRHYVIAGRWVNSVADVVDRYKDAIVTHSPHGIVLTLASLLGFVLAIARGIQHSVRSFGLVVALVLACCVSVTMQLKFCFYHWGVFVAPAALSAAVLADVARRYAARRNLQPYAHYTLAAGTLLGMFALRPAVLRRWFHDAKVGVGMVNGSVSAQERDAHHNSHFARFASLPDLQALTAYVNEHAEPSDTIAVRAFEPAIYLATGRRFPGRFFWTNFLSSPEWSYRIDDWLQEDHQVFVTTPPRFVIVPRAVHQGPNSAETFAPLGYAPAQDIGDWQVLEKKP